MNQTKLVDFPHQKERGRVEKKTVGLEKLVEMIRDFLDKIKRRRRVL